MSNKPESTRTRLASVDAYRGLVMFLMMAEVLHLAGVWNSLRDDKLWHFLAHNQQHAPWATLSARDVIPGTAEYERHAAEAAGSTGRSMT